MRAGSHRAALGLAVLALGMLDVGGLLLSLRSHNRVREQAILTLRERVLEAWPRILSLGRHSSTGGVEQAARYAINFGLASEAEAFSLAGQPIFSFPKASPATHWPSADEIQGLASGSVLTVGPLPPSLRVLSYVSLPQPGGRVVLRLSSEVPDLTADLRERRLQLIGHGATLLILVLAGALIASPVRAESREAPPPALLAYEEAMGRLRHRGDELEHQHAAERRRMEEQIQDKEALARAGELTAGMAHELRNGLGTILGYARLLEREALPPEVGDAARSIREECETLEDVIRRFMDYVKRESLNPLSFDLRRMLSRIASRESRGRAGAGVAIADGEMGAVWGDEGLLERAFENLVRNAREAAGPGGHVRIESLREGEQVVVTVADDGPGMPPDVRSGLRPFFTTKSGGLGLGLALALKLIRLHGGSLGFGDRSPRGLVVTVRLPQTKEP